MSIEPYSTDEGPADTARWRYHVTLENGVPWDVEIVREGGAYYWTLVQDVLLLEKNRDLPFETHQDALNAAVRYITDLETGMW